MPAIAHQNKILGNTSGGGSTILVTTSESSLYGQTITLSDGTTTMSGTFSGTGECEFTGVMMTGNLTLACSGVSQTVSVPYFGNYSFVFSLFSATVNVTYPYTEGATCTLSDGTTTLIATGSPMAFTVPNAGTWTASVELDGNTKTTSTFITTDGQVASIIIRFGTINVTYENDFKGVSITCTLGGTTITKTAPSAGNTMSFYPPETGSWTISGTVSGTPYSTTANVTSLSTPVPVTLETIPDGSTTTPTDDIQKWLACAGIKDKAYTTLSQVLGDSETYNALLGDSNACAYMARSTTWTTDICADQYAMNLLGQYDTACDALLSDSTWNTAICNSTYWESVLQPLVPVMTSDTTPSGTCGCQPEPYDSRYPAYKAFDGDASTFSQTKDSSPRRIYYQFPDTVNVYKCVFTPLNNYLQTRTFQYSDDGSSWSDIDSITPVAGKNEINASLSIGKHAYWGLSQGTSYNTITEIQFYGRTTSSEKVHGANGESAYILDGGSPVTVADPSTLDAGTYTVYSTVAKDPDDLSADYSKTIRICPNTKEIVVRPDNSLYWWGYKGSNLEIVNNANGWSLSGYTFIAPTDNTNYFTTTSAGGSSRVCAYGTKLPITSVSAYKGINQAINVSVEGGEIRAVTAKSTLSPSPANVQLNDTSLHTYTLDVSSVSSGLCMLGQLSASSTNRTSNTYAWWYE